MSIKPGTYVLGPENGALSIHTGKHGAAAMAGHNLHIEVTSWNATIALADDPAQTSVQLTADSRSLRVVDGTGGAKHLGTDDKANIAKTINKEVLKGTEIAFRSTSVHGGDGGLHVHGELDLSGKTQPIEFRARRRRRRPSHRQRDRRAVDLGMKPYHALFGTLKVNDDVEVRIDATLPVPAAG